MTRAAVISDVHGNLPALEAVLRDAEQLAVDAFWFAGDLFNGAPYPDGVLAVLTGLAVSGRLRAVRGNVDEYLLAAQARQGDFPTAARWALVRWTVGQVGQAGLSFLASLPDQDRITASDPDGGFPGAARLLHGSPFGPSDPLVPDDCPAALAIFRRASLWPVEVDPPPLDARTAGVAERLLICGHTHIPWQQRARDTLVINPGSAGMSITGDPRAQYAVVKFRNGRWDAQQRVVAYDCSQLRKEAVAGPFLGAGGPFARACLANILTGHNVAWFFVRHALEIAKQRYPGRNPGLTDAVWSTAEQTFCWQDYGV